MNRWTKAVILMVFIACAVLGIQGPAFADQKQVLLRFHSFPMNPGEKIVAAQVTVSNGEITHAAIPRGWNRQFMRLPNRQHNVRCASTHSSFGINASGRMPVISIADNSSSGKPLTIEASVEIEGADGKRTTRQMLESEYSIQ